MTSISESVSKTSQLADIQLSTSRADQATKIYNECCKKLAELIKSDPTRYGLIDSVTMEELISLIPDPTFKVKSSKKKPKTKPKFTTDNWETVTSKDELKTLKSADLKNILSIKSLPISGNKTLLVGRLWGVLHPEEAPDEPTKKKRGRPSGKKKKEKGSVCTIEESDDEQVNDTDDIQNMLEKRKAVFISEKTRQLCDKDSDGAEEFQLVDKKGWIFKEDEENFEFIGIMENDKLKFTDPPKELYELYAEE